MIRSLLLQTDSFLESIVGWDDLGGAGVQPSSGKADFILTQVIGENWKEAYADLIPLMNDLASRCSADRSTGGYSLSKHNRYTRELLRALTDRELFGPHAGRPISPHAHTYLGALFGLGQEAHSAYLQALLLRTVDYLQFRLSQKDPESGHGGPFGMRWLRENTNFPISLEQVEAFIDALSGGSFRGGKARRRRSPGLYDLVAEQLGDGWEDRISTFGELLWRTAEDLHAIALGDPSATTHDLEWALRFYRTLTDQGSHQSDDNSDDHFGVGLSPHLYTHLTAVLGVGWDVPVRHLTCAMKNQDRVRARLQALAAHLLKVSAVLAKSSIPEAISDGFMQLPSASRGHAIAFYEALSCWEDHENGGRSRRSPHAYTHISALLGANWEASPLQVRSFLNPADIRDTQHIELHRMLSRLSAFFRAVAEQLDPDKPRSDRIMLGQRGLIFPTESQSGSFLLTYGQAAAFYHVLSGSECVNAQISFRRSPHAYTHLSAILGPEWELDEFELDLVRAHQIHRIPMPGYMDYVSLHRRLQRFVHYLRSVAWQLDPENQGQYDFEVAQYGLWSEVEERRFQDS